MQGCKRHVRPDESIICLRSTVPPIQTQARQLPRTALPPTASVAAGGGVRLPACRSLAAIRRDKARIAWRGIRWEVTAATQPGSSPVGDNAAHRQGGSGRGCQTSCLPPPGSHSARQGENCVAQPFLHSDRKCCSGAPALFPAWPRPGCLGRRERQLDSFLLSQVCLEHHQSSTDPFKPDSSLWTQTTCLAAHCPPPHLLNGLAIEPAANWGPRGRSARA